MSSPDKKPYVVLIGGTGAFGVLMKIYYFVLAVVCNGAQKLAIPDFGLGTVDSNYAKLKVRLDELCPDKSRPMILIGHSQGGFLAMWYFIEHPDRVIKVASICAPLHGSIVSHHHLPMPRCFDQLAANSTFMQGTRRLPGFSPRLNAFTALLGEDAERRIFCVSARHDELVQPPCNALLEGATNVTVSGISEHFLTPFHFGMLMMLASFLNAAHKPQTEPADIPAAPLSVAA